MIAAGARDFESLEEAVVPEVGVIEIERAVKLYPASSDVADV
jgi:hypothetical protein